MLDVYVPGQLQEMESPALEQLMTRNCALLAALSAQVMSCADARRGLARNQTGSPVAIARNPTYPAPNSPVSSVSRRLIGLIVVCAFRQMPNESEVGDWQAAENVERRALVAVALAAIAAL